MKIFEFFEVLTLKMALSTIIIIIFIISAPKYSNILIDNKIGGLSLSELYPIILLAGHVPKLTQYVRRYPTCLTHKVPPTKPAKNLHTIPVTALWKQVILDLVGPLSHSTNGHIWLLVMQDFQQVDRAKVISSYSYKRWILWIQFQYDGIPANNRWIKKILNNMIPDRWMRRGSKTSSYQDLQI